MHDMHHCTRYTSTDRKDQAIGRVIQLLPMLSVKELDALADRLGRKVHGVFDGSWLLAYPLLKGEDGSDRPSNGHALAASEVGVDIVGQ